MKSQTPQDLDKALQELELTIQYLIDFRIFPQADGQPDFLEGSAYLDQFAGIGNWKDVKATPHFDVHSVNGKSIYTMPITVSADTLMLLKWHDLTKEELRVFHDRPIL